MLIGGEQASTASFVAVIGGGGVASTESGIHVGSTRDAADRRRSAARAIEPSRHSAALPAGVPRPSMTPCTSAIRD